MPTSDSPSTGIQKAIHSRSGEIEGLRISCASTIRVGGSVVKVAAGVVAAAVGVIASGPGVAGAVFGDAHARSPSGRRASRWSCFTVRSIVKQTQLSRLFGIRTDRAGNQSSFIQPAQPVDVFRDHRQAVVFELFADLAGTETQNAPTERLQSGVAHIVLGGPSWVMMPLIAICFDIQLPVVAEDRKIKHEKPAFDLDGPLPFRRDLELFEGRPHLIFEGTLIIEIVDLSRNLELRPGGRNEDDAPPAAAENRRGAALQRP